MRPATFDSTATPRVFWISAFLCTMFWNEEKPDYHCLAPQKEQRRNDLTGAKSVSQGKPLPKSTPWPPPMQWKKNLIKEIRDGQFPPAEHGCLPVGALFKVMELVGLVAGCWWPALSSGLPVLTRLLNWASFFFFLIPSWSCWVPLCLPGSAQRKHGAGWDRSQGSSSPSSCNRYSKYKYRLCPCQRPLEWEAKIYLQGATKEESMLSQQLPACEPVVAT